MNEDTHRTQATKTTLILGGRGKTGRRVAARLAARGRPLRIGSRSGDPPFDWEDRATWAPLLRDVGAAYVSYYPDLAFPGAAATVRAFTQLAVEHGVRRLVLLSGRGEPAAQAAEQEARATTAALTIVRASFMNQNFSESIWLEPVRSGELAVPAGDVAEPFVDAEDIADVAVAALTDDRHAGQLYEVTGPRLLTFAEATAEIAAATGREVRYVPVSSEQFAAAMTGSGVPADLVGGLTELFAEVLDGHNAYLTDGVRRALGREPRDFRDFARDAAAAGIWGQPRRGTRWS
jgi:uncharacterized protein YbjT (DUF2867 family)